MMSKQLRLGIDNLGPPLLECSCNARVQRLSRSTQQCAVGRISHQRMLEKKGRSRWRPSTKYKPGISQSRKRACHLFHEERDSVGTLHNLRCDSFWKCVFPGQLFDQGRTLAPSEARECQRCDMCMARPWAGELGTEGDEQ